MQDGSSLERSKSLVLAAIIASLALLGLWSWSRPSSVEQRSELDVERGVQLPGQRDEGNADLPPGRRRRAADVGNSGVAGWSSSAVRSGETHAPSSEPRGVGAAGARGDAVGTSERAPSQESSSGAASASLAISDAARGLAVLDASRAFRDALCASQHAVEYGLGCGGLRRRARSARSMHRVAPP